MIFPRTFIGLLVMAVLFGPACCALAQGADLAPNDSGADAQDTVTPALPLAIAGGLDVVDRQPDIDVRRVSANAGDLLPVDHHGAASGAGCVRGAHVRVVVWSAARASCGGEIPLAP
jgi:hypothetical protein